MRRYLWTALNILFFSLFAFTMACDQGGGGSGDDSSSSGSGGGGGC